MKIIEILIMICDITHSMNETKCGTVLLFECHVDPYTAIQNPNESIKDFSKSL